MSSQAINLIPHEEQVEQTKSQLVQLSTYIMVGVFILVLAVSAYLFYLTLNLKKENTAFDTKIENLRAQVKTMSTVEISARNLQARLDAISSFYKTRYYYSTLLKELYARVPSSISIEDFVIAEGTITLSGSSDNFMAISGFISGLTKDNKYFTSVTLNSASFQERNNRVNFLIVVSYDPIQILGKF